MDTRIYICTHKRFEPPKDEIYRPIHVGRSISQALGYEGDDQGDSISEKNKSFCELTGLYWIWKNVDCDIVGIAHYRRYFENKGQLLDKAYVERILCDEGYDIIVPSSGMSEYANNRQHYEKAHYKRDYEITRQVLIEKYPEYERAFDLFSETNLESYCNMLITRKSIYDEYCSWLFDILFEVEKRTDVSGYIPYQARLYGYLSERLLRVWLFMHRYKVREESVRILLSEDKPGRAVLFYGSGDRFDLYIVEIYKELIIKGYECIAVDIRSLSKQLSELSEFLEKPVTAAISFDLIGFEQDIIPEQDIWESLGIPFISIITESGMGDHPKLSASTKAVLLSVTEEGMAEISKKYPNILAIGCLRLAGRNFNGCPRQIADRKSDVLGIGMDDTPVPKDIFDRMLDSKIVCIRLQGAHKDMCDLVFSAMIAGAVVVIDSSEYVANNYKYYPKDKEEDAEVIMTSGSEGTDPQEIIRMLLDDPEKMQLIADNGRRKAKVLDTFSARVSELHRDLLSQLEQDL